MITLNKKGSLIDIGIMFILIFVAIVFIRSNNLALTETTEIGADQIHLLNSYTVAEGARFYLEKYMKYSALQVMDAYLDDFEGSCETNLAGFETLDINEIDFETPDDLRSENMGLTIQYPGITFKKDGATFTLVVSDSDKLSVIRDSKQFKIVTEIKLDGLAYEFTCDDYDQFYD